MTWPFPISFVACNWFRLVFFCFFRVFWWC
uniref:Uncharacterized protein n=1 Tax=Rhizophora mucronata TaxID=61149 RepID=A0A2P2MIB9_RHIMU